MRRFLKSLLGSRQLDHASRYFPIIDWIHHVLPQGGSILDVGSGSLGIGEFYTEPFVGCDLCFYDPPLSLMAAVQASALSLPFACSSFDMVVSSDMLEHIPAAMRGVAIHDMIRVSRKFAILAFPCGEPAYRLDQKYMQFCQRRGLRPPLWLQEHLSHGLVEANEVESVLDNLRVSYSVVGHENLAFHHWLLISSSSTWLNRLFRLSLQTVPGLVKALLKLANSEPTYRKLYFITLEETGTIL
jgi:hypothetical protein